MADVLASSFDPNHIVLISPWSYMFRLSTDNKSDTLGFKNFDSVAQYLVYWQSTLNYKSAPWIQGFCLVLFCSSQSKPMANVFSPEFSWLDALIDQFSSYLIETDVLPRIYTLEHSQRGGWQYNTAKVSRLLCLLIYWMADYLCLQQALGICYPFVDIYISNE